MPNLLPQIVGSLLAVITAIGVIVAAVNPGGGSGSLNGEKTPTPSATAKPGNSGDYPSRSSQTRSICTPTAAVSTTCSPVLE